MALTARTGPGPCPSVRPLTVQVVAPAVEQVAPGTVTVYPVIGELPSDFGGDQEIVPPPSTGTATAALGGPGGRIPGLPAPAGVVTAKVSDEIARTAGPHRRTVGFGATRYATLRRSCRCLHVRPPIARRAPDHVQPDPEGCQRVPSSDRPPAWGNPRCHPAPVRGGPGPDPIAQVTAAAAPSRTPASRCPVSSNPPRTTTATARTSVPKAATARLPGCTATKNAAAAHQASDQWGDRRATRSTGGPARWPPTGSRGRPPTRTPVGSRRRRGPGPPAGRAGPCPVRRPAAHRQTTTANSTGASRATAEATVPCTPARLSTVWPAAAPPALKPLRFSRWPGGRRPGRAAARRRRPPPPLRPW